MKNEATTSNESAPVSITISRTLQLVSAFMLGAIIMYGVGFLNTAAVHNAAHDTRHSQGFPCH
jgi:cobalt transporter subunit CbtB